MVAYASFGRRLWGFTLDCLLDLLVALILRAIGVGEWFVELWTTWLLIHHIGLVVEGGTLGHRVAGLRIVRGDGTRVSVVRAVLRLPLKIASLLPLGAGMLWMLDEPQRRTWHDLGAGTVVVRELPAAPQLAPRWAVAPPWRAPAESTESVREVVSTDDTAV
jgi:uncharacterized RDD family membrane protein YckC